MTFLAILFNLFDAMLFDDLTIRRCVTVAFDDYFFCFFLIFCGSGCWVSFFYFFCVVVGGAVVEYRWLLNIAVFLVLMVNLTVLDREVFGHSCLPLVKRLYSMFTYRFAFLLWLRFSCFFNSYFFSVRYSYWLQLP